MEPVLLFATALAVKPLECLRTHGLRTLFVALLATICAFTFAAPHALAAEPYRELNRAELKLRHELISRGNVHWEAGEFQEALPLYEQAYAMSPHPDLRYRIGQVHEQLGYYKTAAEHYSTYLDEVPSTPYAEKIRAHVTVLEYKSETSGLVGLSIKTEPPGATILFDGERAIDTTPILLPNKSPGTHTITIRLNGYLEEEHTLTLSRGVTLEKFYRLTPEVEPEDDFEEEEPVVEPSGEEEEDPLDEPEPEQENMTTVVDISTPVGWKVVGYGLIVPGTFLLVVGSLGLASDGLYWIDLWGPLLLGGALGVGAGSYLLFIRDWSPRVHTTPQAFSLQRFERSERPTAFSPSLSRGLQLKFRF